MIQLRWFVLCALVVPILTESNDDTMYLTIDDDKSLNNAFNVMQSCFVSTIQCSSNDSAELNQCQSGNSNGYLICCGSHPDCYSSIDIVFMSGIHTLTEGRTFTDLQNIRFSGSLRDSSSTIKCNIDANSGIKFVQVKNLTIEHLNIIDCGMKHTSTSTSKDGDFITHLSALYIQNSTNLLVANVNISNSNGTGLSIVDTNGTINIINSFFSNNRVTIPAELSTILSGGGGIYIEYTECAPGSA